MPCHCLTSLLTYRSVCSQWLQCVRLPVPVTQDFWCGTSENSIFQVLETKQFICYWSTFIDGGSDCPLTVALSITLSLSDHLYHQYHQSHQNALSICYLLVVTNIERETLTSYQSGCCCWYGDTDEGRWEGPHRERRREEAPSLAQQLDTNSNWEKSISAVHPIETGIHPVSTEHTNKGEVLA